MNPLIFLYQVSFLRTLLIIFVIYYGYRLFTRYILPILIDKGVKNIQQKMQDQYRQQNQKPSRPEGEVTIESNRANLRNTERDNGDYVDFEEVD
jgi:hypothetical protein